MRDFPNKKDGYSAVAILTLAQIFAFIDRQIPAMLVEPIKQDFGLSDSEIALLGGAAFSIFYAVMALPIGFAVDRYNRTRVLGIGIFVWSFMTALAGLANSFGKLFVFSNSSSCCNNSAFTNDLVVSIKRFCSSERLNSI